MATKRAYDSTLRRQNAATTRARILEAARDLLLEQGYAATTIPQVAAKAGVAVPTVTGAFANKRTLLEEVLRQAIRGAAAETPLADRFRIVLSCPDGRSLLSEHARLIAEANDRAREPFEIMRKAAAVEPEVEQRRKQGAEDRRADQARVARRLAKLGALRSGVSVAEATDLLWLYSSSDVYRLLVVDRGWSLARFIAWLESSLTAALLPG